MSMKIDRTDGNTLILRRLHVASYSTVILPDSVLSSRAICIRKRLSASDRGHRVVSMNIAVCRSSPLELALPSSVLFSLSAKSPCLSHPKVALSIPRTRYSFPRRQANARSAVRPIFLPSKQLNGNFTKLFTCTISDF